MIVKSNEDITRKKNYRPLSHEYELKNHQQNTGKLSPVMYERIIP